MWFTSDTLFKSWLLLATARQRLLIFSDVVQLTKNYGFSAAILGFITSLVSTGLLCCRFRLFSSLPYVDLFWFHSPFSLESSLKSVRFWDRSSIQSLLPTYVYFWTPCLTIYFIIIIFFVSAYGRKCTAFFYNFHLMWVKNLMYPRYYEAAGRGRGGGGWLCCRRRLDPAPVQRLTWTLTQAPFHRILFGVYPFRLILVLNKSDKFFLTIVIWTISIHLNALTCTCLDFAYFPEWCN